jgi:peptidoglycan/LPS O-acetylase OafA/YrhL
VAILQTISIYTFNHTQENYLNDFYHFILHILFASDWGFQKDWSFNTPIWSVSIEIPIYFLFFFSLFYLKKFNFLFPIILVTIFYYIFPSLINFVENKEMIKLNKWQNLAVFNFPTCIFYFFLGSFILFFLKKYFKHCKKLFILSFISILISIFLLNSNDLNYIYLKRIFPSTVVLFTSLIVFFATIDEIFPRYFKKIILFSSTSYSIYLIHFPLQLIILILFEKYLFNLEIFKNLIIFFIFILILQIISIFSFKYFESPVRKYINSNFG